MQKQSSDNKYSTFKLISLDNNNRIYLHKEQLINELNVNGSQNLIIISIFGQTGTGKSTISNLLVKNILDDQNYPNIFKEGCEVSAQTKGVDYLILQNSNPDTIDTSFLIIDVEGKGANNIQNGINEETLDQIYLSIIEMSDIALYITDEPRIDINNIDILNDIKYQEFYKKITIILNKISEDQKERMEQEINFVQEIQKDERVVQIIKDKYKDFIFLLNKDEDNEDTSYCADLMNYFSQELKSFNNPKIVSIKKVEQILLKLQNIDNINYYQKATPLNLLSIKLSQETKQYELLINQETLEILKNLDKNKKCTVISLLGKSGEGKSTICNQLAHIIDPKIKEDLFQVSSGFNSQTKGTADCLIQQADDQIYIIIDLEGIYGYSNISQDINVLLSNLLILFNLQSLVQSISSTSLYIKSFIRLQKVETVTLQVIKECIIQANQQEKPFKNSFFIFNKLNKKEKESLYANLQNNELKFIKEEFQENIVGVSTFKQDKASPLKKLEQLGNQDFGKDISILMQRIQKLILEGGYNNRMNGEQLADRIEQLATLINTSQFSLQITKDQNEQIKTFFEEQNKQNAQKMDSISKEIEKYIKENQKLSTHCLTSLMLNQSNKQKIKFFSQLVESMLNKTDDYEINQQKQKIKKEMKIREKLIDLYFKFSIKKEVQEMEKKYNQLQNDQINQQENKLNPLDQIGQNVFDVCEQIKNFKMGDNPNQQQDNLILQNNVSDKQINKAVNIQQNNQEVPQSQEFQTGQNIKDVQSFRQNIAFAGIGTSVVTNMIMNLILGKYNNDKMGIIKDGGVGIGLGAVFHLVGSRFKYGSSYLFAAMLISEQVVNFSNPHRSNTAKLKNLQGSVIITGSSLLGGGLATYLASNRLLEPYAVVVLGTGVATSLGILVGHFWNKNKKKQYIKQLVEYIVSQNANVTLNNIDIFLDKLQLKKEILNSVPDTCTHQIQKFVKDYNIKFDSINMCDASKLRIILLYTIAQLGYQLDQKTQKKEEQYKKLMDIVTDLDSFTYYFDLNYIEIGKDLYEITQKIKSHVKKKELISYLEDIPTIDIHGNNPVEQDQEKRKKFCRFELLQKLLSDKINLHENLPEAIRDLKHQTCQALDLWATYICIQFLMPSYVFNQIFLSKVNFNLEQQGMFILDCFGEYKSIFEQIMQNMLQ